MLSIEERRVLEELISKIQSEEDVNSMANILSSLVTKQLSSKQRALSQNLYSYFKDQIETLFS